MRWSFALLALVAVACGSRGEPAAPPTMDAGGGSTAPACRAVYPNGPYGTNVGAAVADTKWDGRSATGEVRSIALQDAIDPCSPSKLLVVRIGAEWCGTCQWQAANGKVLAASDVGARVRFLDVLVRDRDNSPATADAAMRWQAMQSPPADVAIDPDFTTRPFLPARFAFPFVLLVDTRTATLRDALQAPTEDALEEAARRALAASDDVPAPAPVAATLVDGRFSRDQWDMIHAMPLVDPPPSDPTNAVADVTSAATFGRAVFRDPAPSANGIVACSSCHSSEFNYTDGHPTAPEGIGRTPRNSPTLVFTAYQPWQFWDGRADSLWSQALVPIEAPNEIGSSRLIVVHYVYDTYRSDYEAVFGPMPPFDDMTRFPPSGKPGDPSWATMAPADQELVTRAFSNVGKAIEAFERTLRADTGTFAEYVAGNKSALTDDQKDGLQGFFTAGCAQCHWGPRLTNDAFHNLRFPTGRSDLQPDRGQIDGLPQLVASEFGAASVYSDAPQHTRPPPAAGPWTLGAFKTPTLNSVALTAPYGHGGNYAQLTDVVDLHRTAGLPAGSGLTTGDADPWLPDFDPSLTPKIAAFLQALNQPLSQ